MAVKKSIFSNLSEKEVHVWMIDIEAHLSSFNSYVHILSAEETLRANDYIFLEHSTRFVIRRAILRIILSFYTSISPKNIIIRTDQNGKPYLGCYESKIFFSLSYSQNLVYYAISSKPCIGIDIEYISEKPPEEDLAKLVLHSEEYKLFEKLFSYQKRDLFYQYWSQKEALVKAIGIGLRFPLSDIHIEFSNHQVSRLISFATSPVDMWSLSSLEIPSNYVGYIALKGELGPIKYQQLTNSEYV